MTAPTHQGPAIERPGEDEYAPYYGKYIARVPDGNLFGILEAQIGEVRKLGALPASKGTHRYAPGKWTLAEVLGHVNDAERIFSYRALRFARADTTPLPGFEQDDYVRAANFDTVALSDLALEFEHVRHASILLLRNLEPEALKRRGTASGVGMSARAVAYILAGHVRHHLDVINERYLATK